MTAGSVSAAHTASGAAANAYEPLISMRASAIDVHVRRTIVGDGGELRLGERQLPERLPGLPGRVLRRQGAVRAIEHALDAELTNPRGHERQLLGRLHDSNHARRVEEHVSHPRI